MLTPKFVGDLATLESHAYSHRSLTWWGMMGMFAIEATAFALAAAAYLYLMNQEPRWPPDIAPPPLLAATIVTLALFASVIPNHWLKKESEREHLAAVRIGISIMSVAGFIVVGLRIWEFSMLNASWRDNAYGSIVYAVLVLHTAHLLTDLLDTVVLAALMFTKHARGRRYVDVSENAAYWYYVVFTWPPLYVLLYFVPRWVP